MRNIVSHIEGDSAVSAKTANGTAEFERSGPTSARLRLAYEVPGSRAAIPSGSEESLAAGVSEACEAEIQAMRHALTELGETLSSQLSDEGKEPAADQRTNDRDRRDWSDGGTTLMVKPSVYESETALDGYEGAADAKLVRRTVEVAIEHREKNIRGIYRQILEDVRSQRAGREKEGPKGAEMIGPSEAMNA